MNAPRLQDPSPGSWTLEEECEAIEAIVRMFERKPRPEPVTYEQRRERGICSVCPAPARPGQTKCEKHAQAAIRYAKAQQERGYPRNPSGDADWNDRRRETYGEQRRLGLCVSCGRRARAGSARCGKCQARIRDRRKQMKAGIARGGGRKEAAT